MIENDLKKGTSRRALLKWSATGSLPLILADANSISGPRRNSEVMTFSIKNQLPSILQIKSFTRQREQSMTFYVLLHQSQIQLLLCHQKDWISPGFTLASNTKHRKTVVQHFQIEFHHSIPCLLLSALRCPSFTFLKSYVYCVMFAHTLMHACTTNVIWEDLFFGKKCRGALLLLRWSNPIFQYYHK